MYNSTTDHYYKVVEGMSWQDAENAAVSYGGHLVTINDAAEEQWICANLGLSNYGIGFNDIASEGTWVWASGESVGYTNWREHEPNDTGHRRRCCGRRGLSDTWMERCVRQRLECRRSPGRPC